MNIVNRATAKGAAAYRFYKARLQEIGANNMMYMPEECENPYDTDCTDYDDFTEGWCQARDLFDISPKPE